MVVTDVILSVGNEVKDAILIKKREDGENFFYLLNTPDTSSMTFPKSYALTFWICFLT
jgi:hypothetical protein